MKRSKEMATYERPLIEVVNGRFATRFVPEEVRVMARAEGYAMVRKKGGGPFVVCEKDLRSPQPSPAGQEQEGQKG